MSAELLHRLENLRAITGILKGPLERRHFPFTLAGGIPRGAITAIHGPEGGGKTQAVLDFLAENPGCRVAWIESRLTLYPCALPRAGVAPERVLFVEAGEHALWCVHQCLRSGLFGVVVVRIAATAGAGETDLRRLQLASERAEAAVLVLSEAPFQTRTWAVALRLRVSRSGRRLVIQHSGRPDRGQGAPDAK